MLLSMTGHGEAQCVSEEATVQAEVRTINSRFYKLNVRISEGLSTLESRIDELVRQQVRRGTVQVNIRCDRRGGEDDYRINRVAIESYRRQIQAILGEDASLAPMPWSALLTLPGVVEEPGSAAVDLDSVWSVIEPVLAESLERLREMRRLEGEAMREDLRRNCQEIGNHLRQVDQQAPQVTEAYRRRLLDRINALLAEHEVSLEPRDIVREVGVFAERCDISEESVRLRSHLDQFLQLLDQEESSGRKLEFLTQEMHRETNTIGSKANDAVIARHVVEIKSFIERMREMIQNVE